MKAQVILLSVIFVSVLLPGRSFAQYMGGDSLLVDSLEMDINPDSIAPQYITDDLHMVPADVIYSHRWDTLYIRRQHFAEMELRDSLVIVFDTSFCIPVKGEFLSPFGWRGSRIHSGVDIRLAKGDSVRCAFDGVVRMSRYYSGYGNMVLVRHNNGLETLYGHLSKRLAQVNDIVKAGDVIGLGGRTGRATCDHLHFETRFLEEAFNPLFVFDFKRDTLACSELVIKKDLLTYTGKPENYDKVTVPSEVKYYTVKKGDTLYSIARRNKTTVERICRANKIKKESILSIGQSIRIE